MIEKNFKPKIYFVTGTDTEVGKTICCKALLQAANQQKLTSVAYKPIAAGCEITKDGLRNEDALILQQHSNIKLSYHDVNPISFLQPIAPHIAAQIQNTKIDTIQISQGLKNLHKFYSDVIIVEGAGGWRLPLNQTETLADWVIAEKLSVILVVGMKLGCLNHAILTYESILHDGLQVVGWIANQVQSDMPFYQQNIALLSNKIDAPLLAEIPHLKETHTMNLANFVDFNFN
jgi:dethiobiotin synthetase